MVDKNIKAVLFDMDGVLLDSERQWRKYEVETFQAVGIPALPDDIKKQIYGISMQQEYALLKDSLRISVSYEEYVSNYDRFSQRVYSEATLANNLEETLATLKTKGIKLAVVSASLQPWIELMLTRLQKRDYFDLTISIADTSGLKPKPAPDGYLKAMEILNVTADQSLVIEDSNRGIQSGKAAGIFTIASKEFVDDTYIQTGFDQQIAGVREIVPFI